MRGSEAGPLPMKVTVSVLGRFHAFYLARELARHGSLDRLITSYPRWGVTQWDVPGDHVRSLWPVEAARRSLPRSLGRLLRRSGRLHDAYDFLAARCVPETSNIVTAWSGSAERTLRVAQERGASAIVERCSSHIRTQREILLEEYGRHRMDPQLPSDAAIDREEREYELADRIAVPSSFVERTFLARGLAKKKLLRIPYGVDPEEFRPIEKEDKVFRVIFAGSMGVRKGTLYLLKAFAELDLPDAELLLLGAVQEEATSWLARYSKNVRHPGHIPQKDLYRWYSQGSVFVMPSVEEGMAYVQLQAMSCGLPLICTPNTGGEDLVREGREGFVVPVGDVESLKERLKWCFQNREACREMGRAARQRVLQDFTWRDYGSRVISFYREILEDSEA